MAARSRGRPGRTLVMMLILAFAVGNVLTESSENTEGSDEENWEGPVLLNTPNAAQTHAPLTTKAMGSQPRTLSGANNLSKVVNELLKQVAESKSEEEYQTALSNYESFKSANKDKGICLPRAPSRRRAGQPLTRVHKDCEVGYRIGWRHGKRWAHIVYRNGDSKSAGLEKVECFLNNLEPSHVEARHVCAVKGALAGYERWYGRLRDPKERAAFEALKEAEPSPLVEIHRPVRATMTPEETAYVHAFGLHKAHN